MKARMALMTVMALVLVLSLALISSLSMAQESALQAPLDTAAATPLSTSFTYQGELRKDGDLVNGICDFRFLLYDSELGGSQIGPTLDRVGLAVADGLFTIADLAFGSGAFAGEARWLEIAVQCDGDPGYNTLWPRQKLTAAPYALYAPTAGSAPWSGLGGVPAGFADGVDDDTTYSAGNQLDLAGTTFDVVEGAGSGLDADLLDGQQGSYYLDWNSLTNVPAGFADGVDNNTTYSAGTGLSLAGTQFSMGTTYRLPQSCGNGQIAEWNGSIWICGNDDTGQSGSSWSLTGNAGTSPSTHFLGTTDNQALEVRVNSARALRIEPQFAAPNLIAGHSANEVTGGAEGATISGGGSSIRPNQVTDDYGTVGGGYGNNASGYAATIGGGYVSTASGYAATIGGGYSSTASGHAATIGGGYSSTASGYAATVGGGYGGTASGYAATVGGGYSSTASGEASVIGGGSWNSALADFATIGGGSWNNVQADYATIAGGGPSDPANPDTTRNRVTDGYGTIGGGGNNQAGDGAGDPANATYATVAGGWGNQARRSYSFVGGGFGNEASGEHAAIAGGSGNDANAYAATVSGGLGNQVLADFGTICGGGRVTITDPATANRVTDNYGTIGGGGENQAGDGGGDPESADYATVGGGARNHAEHQGATVGGGFGNYATNESATIGGGSLNRSRGRYSTVGGGSGNEANGGSSTVGGGWGNIVTADYATIGGGWGNTASGQEATVAGGLSNDASGQEATIGGGKENQATGTQSTVAGGAANLASYRATVSGGLSNQATGDYSMIPGGYSNVAASTYSFAAGNQAQANHAGTFVWADSNNFPFASLVDNSFKVRATGGVRFVVGIDGSGNTTWSCVLTNGNAWSCSSDRDLKENFEAVDGLDVLERLGQVPIQTWNAKGADPGIRHMGPMAQDFYAAFGLGEDDKHISTMDADGVALAAIQGLYQLNQELHAENAARQAQIDSLEARLAALEAAGGGTSLPVRLPGGWLLLGGGIVAVGLVAGRHARGGGR